MPPLQIRNMPQDVYEELTQVAKDEHRSAVQQALFYIKRGIEADKSGGTPQAFMPTCRLDACPLSSPSPYRSDPQQTAKRKAQVADAIAKLKAMPPLDLPDDFPSAEELIREDRDSR